jgi:redox-sensitive bicupin YhaK (pirin superfamily)
VENSAVMELKVHSQNNCFLLTPEQMNYLQNNVAVSVALGKGVHMVKLRHNSWQYPDQTEREATAMLWIHGGAFVNQSTGVEVNATWASLQGYDDVLVLDVKEPATLRAFLFGTQPQPTGNPLTLSVARVESAA